MYTEHFVVLLYMYKITVTDLLGFSFTLFRNYNAIYE